MIVFTNLIEKKPTHSDISKTMLKKTAFYVYYNNLINFLNYPHLVYVSEPTRMRSTVKFIRAGPTAIATATPNTINNAELFL